MKFKKALTGMALLAVTGLVAYGCRPGGHFKKFCSDDYPENILTHIDKRVKDLNLTGAQLDKYNAIRAEVKADMTAARNDRLMRLDEVNDQLAKQNPDIEIMARNLKKHHDEQQKKHEDKFNRYFDQVMELYRMLDKDQQGKIIDKLREAGKRFSCK